MDCAAACDCASTVACAPRETLLLPLFWERKSSLLEQPRWWQWGATWHANAIWTRVQLVSQLSVLSCALNFAARRSTLSHSFFVWLRMFVPSSLNWGSVL